MFELYISLDSASQVLEKYEDEFIAVVNAKHKLRWLKRKKVISNSLVTEIENSENGKAKELLFEYLHRNADVASLREYCKMVITEDPFPKMKKLGEKMLHDLPPEGMLWQGGIVCVCVG